MSGFLILGAVRAEPQCQSSELVKAKCLSWSRLLLRPSKCLRHLAIGPEANVNNLLEGSYFELLSHN